MSRHLLLLVPLCCCMPAVAQQLMDEPRRGWHFYEDPVQPPSPRPLAGDARSLAPHIARYKALQKAVEDARVVAIMAPSASNVRAYLELEASVLRKASRFADVSRRVAWMSPELDPSAQSRPTATYAVEAHERQQMEARQARVASLGQDHIVLFFFRSDCPYCHAFAPVLKEFQRFGLQVAAVSTDGGSLLEFPRPRKDNGIALTLGVKQVPALFLAHPASGRIVPLGFGVLSESELLERIATVSGPELDKPVAASRQE